MVSFMELMQVMKTINFLREFVINILFSIEAMVIACQHMATVMINFLTLLLGQPSVNSILNK